MSSQLSPYDFPPVTQEALNYADLPIIDISKFPSEELVSQAKAALKDGPGFFYVVNHGLNKEQVARMFAIGQLCLTSMSEEDKQKYHGTMEETGSYQGYKRRGYWHLDNGVRDQCEMYNINHDVNKREHPEVLRPYLLEIEAFQKHNHDNVVHPLLRLLARGVGLSDDQLVDIHGYSELNHDYLRMLKFYPRPQYEEEQTGGVWLKGHADRSSITLLYSQPISSLQIQFKPGEWKWVKHVDNALVVNCGEALQFLTGGVYRATIHRVVQPPPDQRHHTRLSLVYFAFPNDDIKLCPIADLGANRFKAGDEPTMEAWRKERTAKYGRSETKKDENGDEEEVIQGVVVKHYH